MRRRELGALLLGIALCWPWTARAQQAQLPVVGFLRAALPASSTGHEDPVKAGFLDELAESGHAEGGNVAIEYRTAKGHYDRLPALAADLASESP